jgi:hypothetical protein
MLKRNKMKLIEILLVVACLSAVTGFYLYNKPVKSTSSKKTDVVLPAEELFNEFAKDENAANGKFLAKIISVKGKVENINTEDGVTVITLKTASDMFGVVCKMEGGYNANLKKGDSVNLKGVCTGMLMDVVMVRCVIED